ncbi:hypothetical protein Ddc_11571 [Ditylenchus destructor]|nr:hypothetical protein Ddc_11571 [Ditylenchus destructor]
MCLRVVCESSIYGQDWPLDASGWAGRASPIFLALGKIARILVPTENWAILFGTGLGVNFPAWIIPDLSKVAKILVPTENWAIPFGTSPDLNCRVWIIPDLSKVGKILVRVIPFGTSSGPNSADSAYSDLDNCVRWNPVH